jgi:TonB family protein
MGGVLPWTVSGVLLFATVVITPVPFQLSEEDWKARCPAIVTTGDLKARGVKLKAIHQPLPEYPRIDADIGRPGSVVVLARIDTKGSVVDVQLVRAWHPNFVAGAIDAVKQWRFKEVIVDGRPTCVLAKFEVEYRPEDY